MNTKIEQSAQPSRNSIVPGVYEHFKGNVYHVYGVAEDTETGRFTVFYSPQYGPYGGKLCNRELGMFLEIVRNHKERPEYVGPRFRLVEAAPFIREGSMTPQKILEVLATYEALFQEMKATPQGYPHDQFLPQFGNHEAFSHCYEMIGKVREFLEERRIDKSMRCLGFIQGVLWAKGAYKLKELMEHSRPAKKRQKK